MALSILILIHRLPNHHTVSVGRNGDRKEEKRARRQSEEEELQGDLGSRVPIVPLVASLLEALLVLDESLHGDTNLFTVHKQPSWELSN